MWVASLRAKRRETLRLRPLLRTDGTVLQVTTIPGEVLNVVTIKDARQLLFDSADRFDYLHQADIHIVATELAVRTKSTPEWLIELAEKRARL